MNLKKALSLIICLFLLVGIGAFLIYPKVKKSIEAQKEYYEAKVYELEESEPRGYSSDTVHHIVSSASEYKKYLEQEKLAIINGSDEIEYKDYEKYDYLLVFIPTNDCGENIHFTEAEVNDAKETITIIFESQRTCVLCALEYELHEIKLAKETSYYDIEIEWDVKGEECDPNIAYKPILYLYPTITTNITVDFAKEENLTTTYPKFYKEWNITVHPNGDIYDENNKYYYALYWEEQEYTKQDFKEGFYVSDENAISFLEEKLNILGLNHKEQNEFIMYWLPILEKNEHSLVYFELTDDLQKDNELIINPKPDTLIRIRMHVKKIDYKKTIKEQQLSKQKRIGYTAVEWGGVIYN